jgi:heme iron utilization protein
VPDQEKIQQLLRSLFHSQSLAVLSTCNAGQPYGSLVAFAASEDLGRLYFATPRATRKYAYLSREPRVSMLIDNRSNTPQDFHDAAAVTALGKASEVPSSEGMPEGRQAYLSRHPYLEGFLAAPGTAFFEIAVNVYLMVNRFQNVVEYRPLP